MALKRKDTITKNRVKALNKKFIRDNSTLDSATQPHKKNKKNNKKLIKIEKKTSSSSDLEDKEIVTKPVEKEDTSTVRATTSKKQTSLGSDNSEVTSSIKNIHILNQSLELEISKPTQTSTTTNSSMKRKLNSNDVENGNSKKKNKKIKVKFNFSRLF
jgi:hypothetical protein